MSSIDGALAAFEPISLDDANQIAELQTRIDRKYLVDEATLVELLDAMPLSVRVLEIDDRRSCEYRSTYFDTEDLALFRAAAQGRRHRYKVRSRSYGDTGPCYLEVKAKGHRGANVKSRIAYCRSDHDAITPDGRNFVEEMTGFNGLASALLPVLSTAYERSTLIDSIGGTRLTIDRRVRCAACSNSPRDGEVGGEAALDGIVVETKSPRAPSTADLWLWRHHVRPTRISKFCTGLGAIHPDLPANKWHRVIARHWTTPSIGPTATHSRVDSSSDARHCCRG